MVSLRERPEVTAASYPPPRAGSRGRPWTIAGAVCAVVALIFLPIVLGPLGAIFGFIGYSKRDRWGLYVAIFAIAATIAGMAIGFAVLNARS
jgi:hypothetical protein